MTLPTLPILNIPIRMGLLEHAVDWAGQVLRHEVPPAYICHINVHSLVTAQDQPLLASALRQADFAAADGMPLVWIGRLRGYACGRVYGPDFMQALFASGQQLVQRPCRHFLYGSTPEVLEKLSVHLARTYPQAQICGKFSPPFGDLSPAEEETHCAMINQATPDILWVGLGAPRQELWMARCRPRLQVPLVAGVGAAFDFFAGTKPQAPRWIRQAGLEWAFRWLTEPRRLTGRYAQTMPRFVMLALAEIMRGTGRHS